jgi:hypothetical protein
MPPDDNPRGAGQLAEKPALKLSRVRRGHWRSRWRSQKDCRFSDRMEKAGVWLGRYPWPSAEIAEQKALDWLARHEDVAKYYGIEFLDVLFFPADAQGGG